MELVLNGINGHYLRNITERAEKETERVDAAVAYATDSDLLFEWCWEKQIPLRYWGRFDDQVPVAIPVLSNFLNRRSGSFTCKLVRHFHPKVIWWHGHGAYIGSANLTQSAWWNNVEAGVFLTEAELIQGGQDIQLLNLFDEIDRHAAPLTKELFDLLSVRSKTLAKWKAEQRIGDIAFLGTDLATAWDGLAVSNKVSASERQRRIFLNEWNSTLQIIRDISEKISTKGNRPKWVNAEAPLGAQADQFLHAHYYQKTFDGNRADYERHFDRNKANPDKAVESAIRWWSRLPRSEDEAIMLNEVAPYLREAFSEPSLRSLTEKEFIQVLGHIHAAKDYARRAPNSFVGLPGGGSMQHDTKS